MIKYLRLIFLAILVLVPGGEIFAQEFASPEIKGFKKESEYPVYTPDDLWDYINGGADSYNAMGFQNLNIVEYRKGRKISVKLEVYQHSNSEMAFGIYAMERAPSYSFIKLGVQGYKGEGFYNFLKGKYYVKIYTHSKSKKALEAVDMLAEQIEEMLEGSVDLPEIVSIFPKQGKLENTEMYISENVIGHEFLSNAFRSSYNIDNKQFDVYLFIDSPQSSISEMATLYLKRHDLDSDMTGEGKYSFKDGYNGNIYLAWKNKRMVLITGLEDSDAGMTENIIATILN